MVATPLSISSSNAGTVPHGSIAFTASGGAGPYVFSLLENRSGGSISATGGYKAGKASGTTDVVQVTDSLGSSASLTIEVVPPLAVSFHNLVPSGESVTLTATGGSGDGRVWSIATNESGGSISETGAYKAGAKYNVSDVVKVTDSFGLSATSEIKVIPPHACGCGQGGAVTTPWLALGLLCLIRRQTRRRVFG